MPAYFSLDFELKKTPTIINDFCTGLLKSGLVFKSGFMEFENDTFEETLNYNQEKLNSNFTLEDMKHPSENYKQIYFNCGDFSEVRVLFLNTNERDTFYSFLIIPEDDFLEYEKGNVSVKAAQIDTVKALAKNIWSNTEALSIQTSWEGSDFPPTVYEIQNGTPPQAEPFCIIPSSIYDNKQELPLEKLDRNGVLIDNSSKWEYV